MTNETRIYKGVGKAVAIIEDGIVTACEMLGDFPESELEFVSADSVERERQDFKAVRGKKCSFAAAVWSIEMRNDSKMRNAAEARLGEESDAYDSSEMDITTGHWVVEGIAGSRKFHAEDDATGDVVVVAKFA